MKKDIPLDLADNLRNLRPCYDIMSHSEIKGQNIDAVVLQRISNYLSTKVTNTNQSLTRICLATDADYGFVDGTSLLIAKHLIYTGQWDIDLMKPFRPGISVGLFL